MLLTVIVDGQPHRQCDDESKDTTASAMSEEVESQGRSSVLSVT